MSTALFQAYIGQVCEFTAPSGVVTLGELTAAEGGWLQVTDTDGRERLLNSRLLRSVAPVPEKEQEKYREKARRRRER